MDEYIEKGDALEALQSEGITRNMRAYRKVQAIPAARVVPSRRAYWIRVVGGQHKCGFCHTVRKTDVVRDHYCPNCGAKILGERK